MQEERQARRDALLTGLCAFLLPALLFGTVLAAMGIYPFGEKSLLIIDMNSEYVDYLAQMNESIRTGGGLTRSWNMGMGLNMLGLIAFYAASPFNLLVMLFPVEVITEVLFVITLLKIGLAGLLFSNYTNCTLGRRGLFAVLFSTAYALNAYGIAYASNIMWLDGMAFLPLVLLGVERLLRENKCGVFLFGLIYTFLSSYYIAYMIGAFSLLYFLAGWLSEPRPVRQLWPKLGRFFGSAVLAAGCCAFLLLPAFLNLRSGQSSMWDIPLDFTLKKPFIRIASRLLPGVYDTLTDAGYPNIYCTSLAVFLCVMFFLHRGASRREKVVYGALTGLLFLSFSCEFLDLAWHAFEDPTWFPARYSFVFCFLVIYLAMRAAGRVDTFTPAGVTGALLLLTLLIVEIGVQRFRYVELPNLLAGILLPLCYGLLCLIRNHREHAALPGGQTEPARLSRAFGARARTGFARPGAARKLPSLPGVLLAAAALVLTCAELWANAWSMEQNLDGQFVYRTRESYTAFREKYQPAIEATPSVNEGAYRLEIVEQRNANGGMALGYNGISHYSTTTDQALNAFLRRLGYNKGTANELRFTSNTPLTNGLLGIRYVLSEKDLGGGYETIGGMDGVGIEANSCAFPMAFYTSGTALRWDGAGEDPFTLQNNILGALSGFLPTEAFLPLENVEWELVNVDVEEKDGYLLYTPRVKDEPSAIEFVIQNPEDMQAYAYFPVWDDRFSVADVFVDGRHTGRELSYRGNTVIPLGSGREIRVTLQLIAGSARIKGQYFYALDLDTAQRLAEDANRNAMRFTRFTDTTVAGAVTAEKDGALVTTFPYDDGWRVWQNGKRVQPERFADVFLALPLEAGEHEIVMLYVAPGFPAGCAVSAVSLLGIFLWCLRRYLLNRQCQTADSERPAVGPSPTEESPAEHA